ncbi:MAG: hypothetical protein AAFY88_11190 [Acidobacteriota bacterium]
MRRLAFLLLLLLLLLALGAHSAAQAPPADPGRSGAGGEEPLSTFEPSEKVPADTAVAFPVDI